MAKKQKKSKKNDGKKAAEAKNLAEVASKSAVVDLSLIHISEPTRHMHVSRMPSSA